MTDNNSHKTRTEPPSSASHEHGYETLVQVRERARIVASDQPGVWRACKECKTAFCEPLGKGRANKDFCRVACQEKWNVRRRRRGMAIIDAAMKWRRGKRDAEALAVLCQRLGIMIEEDKVAGRPSW